MSGLVAVDTGGTFTDLVSFDPVTDGVSYTKSLTTHANPIEGILNCIDKVGARLDGPTLFKHGTTLVINTLLERNGPAVALVTTKGFRDVLEFGRGNRTALFDLFFKREPALVERRFRFELGERTDGDGVVLQAPDRTEVEALALTLRDRKVAAIAVSFINSYLEPQNELIVAEWLRELLPDCFVTAGSELTREWYEYERTATAAANAYTGPKIGGYVSTLDSTLRSRGFGGQLFLMGSGGGVLSGTHAASAPILLIESGPVGGCIGAGAYGEQLGFKNIIAFDMGGTTAKCALVTDGRFSVESLYHVGGYGRGTPIRAPVLDIVEVGTGGGSIAWLDEQARLHVGPRSAGSSPGPVCYGLGGENPTVTDANLTLGRLNPAKFQGGEMGLDVDAARSAIGGRLATPLGYVGESGVHEVAAGIVSIALVQMGEAIKRVTVQRGEDPREFILFAYGGGGPLHASDLARELAIPLVVIPPEAGNFSAIGMLLADIRRDESRTFVARLGAEALARVGTQFANIEAGLLASIEADFGESEINFERHVEMRFVGQQHSVKIELQTDDADLLMQSFVETYRNRYGHAIDGSEAEIVALHCSGIVRTPRPDIARLAGTLDAEPVPPSFRPVYYTEASDFLATPVFQRASLPVGFNHEGQAVIEEYGSTTIVGPKDSFSIGPLGEIRIRVGHSGWATT